MLELEKEGSFFENGSKRAKTRLSDRKETEMERATKNGITVALIFWLILFGLSCNEGLTPEEYCRNHNSCAEDGSSRDAVSAPEEGPCVRTDWRDDLTNAAWRLVPKIKNLSQPAENLPQFPSFESRWETNCVTRSLVSYVFDIVPDDVLTLLIWSSTNFVAKRLLLDDGTTAEFYMFPATATAEDTVFSATAFYLVYRDSAAIWAEYHLKQGDTETYNFILPLTGNDRFDIVEPQIFFSEFNERNSDLAGASKSEPDKCGQFVEMCNFAAAIGSGLACSAASAKVTTWCVATVVGGSAGAAAPATPAVCGFLAALTEIWCSYTLSTAFSVIICNGWLRCYAPFMSDCECPLENPCASEIATCHEMCEGAISTPACSVFKEIVGGATHIRENHIADAFCDRLFAAASRDNCDTLCADECGDCVDACGMLPRHSTASCVPTEYPGYWADCVQLDGDVCNEAMFYRDMFCRGARLDYICYEGPCHPDGCGSTEICLNLIDDDCDGDIDLADTDCLASCDDNDGDGYEGTTPTCPDGDDCNDFVAAVHPGAPEYCNGLDDNCNDVADEGLACPSSDAGTDARDYTDTTDARDASDATDARDVVDTIDTRDVADTRDTCECTPSDTRPCTASCGTIGNQTCSSSCVWGTCQPPSEVCDGTDNDCDGSTDEGFDCRRGVTGSCSTSCGTTGARTCSTSCTWGSCQATEVCNHCDDDGDTAIDDGFECVRDSVRTCPTNSSLTQTCSITCVWPSWCDGTSRETCNGLDDDGDGQTDEDFDCIRGVTDTCGCLSDTRITGTTTCNSSCRWGTCVFPTSETNCTDDRDNDCDNDTDCDDSNCSSSSACLPDDYCSSGRCCDTSTHRLKPSGTPCASASTTFLRCSGSGCGSDVTNNVCPAASCTGDSPTCPSVTCPERTTNCSSSQQCSSGSTSCVSCSSCVPTPPEICNNRDDDCDTHIDEGLSQSCTRSDCPVARQTCVAGSWTTCVCI